MMNQGIMDGLAEARPPAFLGAPRSGLSVDKQCTHHGAQPAHLFLLLLPHVWNATVVMPEAILTERASRFCTSHPPPHVFYCGKTHIKFTTVTILK